MGYQLQTYLDDVSAAAWKSIPPDKREPISPHVQDLVRAQAIEGGFWEPPEELPENS